jgi:hypothetical protein
VVDKGIVGSVWHEAEVCSRSSVERVISSVGIGDGEREENCSCIFIAYDYNAIRTILSYKR